MQRNEKPNVLAKLGNSGWYLIPVLLWSLIGAMIVTVEPSSVADVLFQESYLPLALLFFLALFHSIFAWSRQALTSLLYAFGATLLLELLLWQQLHWWHVAIYLLVIIFFEYYLRRERKTKKTDDSDRVDS